jgi:colanic acid/amylovoran biosynthesis glycosyltransferase
MPKISNQQQADRPEVIIFRNNLFRISEPFITEQAEHLRRYQPLYLGRLRFGDPPVEATSLALQDSSGWTTLPRIAWHTLTRDPAAYRRLLQRRRPALIHAHFGTDGVYALPLAQQLGLPLITTFHGFDATLSTAALLSSPAWMNYPLFRRRLARQGDLFLCVSSFIRDCVLALGFPEQRTLLHNTGIDCEAIRPRDPAAESPMIVHVARLVEMKGTAYLIRAFAALPQRHRNVALVIIGDGELNRMLRKLAGCLGVADRVQFRGALPHRQALEHIRNAAMLVLPSVHTSTGRVEGLGMVLLEAAATGVPVVASCVGGIREGILDRQTGLLVPERDADALCTSITTLLDEPATRHRMGLQARGFVERTFDLRVQNAILENHYDRVVSAGTSLRNRPMLSK